MKTLTTAAETKATTARAIEPILIIQVDWDSGTVYYSEKTFTLGALSVVGKIVSFNPIQSVKKTDSVGEVSGASVVLDDTDGALKTIVNTEIIEGKTITVYQHFEGNAQSDLTLLLKGKIAGGIGWNEGERTLDISIDTSVEDKEVGFAPDEEDIPTIYPPSSEKPWPLCFGTVIHVPAVKVLHNPDATLLDGVNQDSSSFIVKGGDLFPQTPTVVTIKIGNVQYTGTFDGEEFTVTTANDIIESSLLFTDRPIGDPHEDDPRVAWLVADHNIANLWCYINTGYGYTINKCYKQEGKKCFFIEPCGVHASDPRNVQYVALGSGASIAQTAGISRSSWSPRAILERASYPVMILETGEIVFRNEYGQSEVTKGKWQLHAGMEVFLVTDYENTWVCNLLPSTEILAVYGHRDINGEEYLVPIPSSYYTKVLSDSLGGKTPTTIAFSIPLEDRSGENWKGDVFVSLRSSVGSNVANIIRWLVEEYTDLACDGSFNTIATKVGLYPANFAVFTQPNVLKLIEDIAWQSRCAVYIRNGIISIDYLSELKTAVDAIDESVIEFKSLQLGFSDTDDIVTKLIANWKKDYSGDDSSDRRVIYKNNIDVFDLHEDERDFFIYNNGDLAKLSAYWWGYRYSNSWRKVSFKTFLDTLALDVFDVIEHDIAVVSTNTLRGIIDDISQDSDEHSLTFKTELASKAGDSDSGQPIEDTNYFLGDPNFPVDPWNNPIDVPDPGDGFSEVDYTVPPETDGEDTKPPDPPQYDLVMVNYPDVVERGVAFSVRIEARDSDDNLLNVNLTASLVLSTAGADTLTPLSVNLVSGVFQGDLTIDDDSGNQTGYITASASGYGPSQTDEFDIIDVRSSLTFVGPIPSVTRGVAQSTIKVVSGAVSGEVINVILNTATNDKLYDSGGSEITQLTADALGDFYLPANWYIADGQGTVNGQLIFTDTAQLKYDALASNSFGITGGSSIVVSQSIALSQTAIPNQYSLVMTAPTSLGILYPFALRLEVHDIFDEIVDTYTGKAKIRILNESGNVESGLRWISAGDESQVFNEELIVDIVDGIWSSTDCYVDIISTYTGITVTLEATDISDSNMTDSELVDIANPYFTISFLADQVVRGTDYDLVLTARNPDGSIQDDYEPVTTPTLTIVSGDPLDAVLPATIPASQWIDGVAILDDFSIDGGSSIDETVIKVAEGNRIGTERLIVVADSTPSAKLITPSAVATIARSFYVGYTSTALTSGDPCGADYVKAQEDNYYAQNAARSALRADAVLTENVSIDQLLDRYQFQGNTNYYFSSTAYMIRSGRIEISAADRAAAFAAQLRMHIRGPYFGSGANDWFDPFLGDVIKIGYTYTPTGFNDGDDLYTKLTNIEIIPVADQKEYTLANGGGAYTNQERYFTIPFDWIANMSGDPGYIYIWMCPVFNTLAKSTVCPGTLEGQLRAVVTQLVLLKDTAW